MIFILWKKNELLVCASNKIKILQLQILQFYGCFIISVIVIPLLTWKKDTLWLWAFDSRDYKKVEKCLIIGVLDSHIYDLWFLAFDYQYLWKICKPIPSKLSYYWFEHFVVRTLNKIGSGICLTLIENGTLWFYVFGSQGLESKVLFFPDLWKRISYGKYLKILSVW